MSAKEMEKNCSRIVEIGPVFDFTDSVSLSKVVASRDGEGLLFLDFGPTGLRKFKPGW